MAYQRLDWGSSIQEEPEAVAWLTAFQKSDSLADRFELDDFIDTSSLSILNENEIFDSISLSPPDYQLLDEEQRNNDIEEFLSAVKVQFDTISNESETTCFDINSIMSNENKTKDNLNIVNNSHSNGKSILKRLASKAKNLNYEDNKKKQSNKEAAVRYRQKKIKEKSDLFTTRDLYKQENDNLKKKIEEIQLEINFVKNILVEMLLKKV